MNILIDAQLKLKLQGNMNLLNFYQMLHSSSLEILCCDCTAFEVFLLDCSDVKTCSSLSRV